MQFRLLKSFLLLAVFFTILLISAFPSLISAREPETGLLEETDSVLLEELMAEEKFLPSPTSPFYFLQSYREGWERITVRFPEAQAETALRQVRRRLLEIYKLTQEGEKEEVEEIMYQWQERYQMQLRVAETKVQEAGKNKGEVKEMILERRKENLELIRQMEEESPQETKPFVRQFIEDQIIRLNQWLEQNFTEEEREEILRELEPKLERIYSRFEQKPRAKEKIQKQVKLQEASQYFQEGIKEQKTRLLKKGQELFFKFLGNPR